MHKPSGWTMDVAVGPEKGRSLWGQEGHASSRNTKGGSPCSADMCGCRFSQVLGLSFLWEAERFALRVSRVFRDTRNSPSSGECEFSGLRFLLTAHRLVPHYGIDESLQVLEAESCWVWGLSGDAREGTDTPGRREPKEPPKIEPKRSGLLFSARRYREEQVQCGACCCGRAATFR